MPTLDERARRRAWWLVASAAVTFTASVARGCPSGRQAGRREHLRRIAAALCDTLCPPPRVDGLLRLEAIEVVEPDTLCFRYALDARSTRPDSPSRCGRSWWSDCADPPREAVTFVAATAW